MSRGDFDVYPNTATYNAVIKVGQGVGWMIKAAMAVKQHSMNMKYLSYPYKMKHRKENQRIAFSFALHSSAYVEMD